MHLGSIELGNIRVDVICGGAVWMDGGAIFGVVPKPLWSSVVTPDEKNRVRLSYLSLLARSNDVTVVVEAGAASHQPPKMVEHLKADDSSLVETLATLGVGVEDVDYFIPSHLHFDHVGAAGLGEGEVTFPEAAYVLQKAEWEEANDPIPINSKAYLPGDIAPLHSAKLLIVDGEAEVVPGIRVKYTGGHSVGHQTVWIGDRPDETVVFAGDMIPTSEHISPRWMCALDLFPVANYKAKLDLLTRAAEEGLFIAPGHGGMLPVCTVTRTSTGKFIAQRVSAIAPSPKD